MSDQLYQLVKESGMHTEAIKNLHALYASQKAEFDTYVKTHADNGKSRAQLILSLLALIVSLAGFIVTLFFNIAKVKP